MQRNLKAGVGVGLVASMVFVVTVLATSLYTPLVNDGTYKAWKVNSENAPHVTYVNEGFCWTQDPSFLYSTTVGDRDSYIVNISSIPNGATITDIHIKPCAASYQLGGSPSTMAVFYRLNGQNSMNTNYNLPFTTSTVTTLPTSTWSNVNVVKNASTTLEIGVGHRSGTNGSKLSRIFAIVDYK